MALIIEIVEVAEDIFKITTTQIADEEGNADWELVQQVEDERSTDEFERLEVRDILNLKQFQKDNGDRVPNFGTRLGSAATARAIAEQFGVGKTTVRNAEKFADAVEALQEISPQAAERVLRGEVRDALTELPKVASANFQCHSATWT